MKIKTCTLEITSEQWDEIEHCEAVVIREFENIENGDRVAGAVAWGDAEEMRAEAFRPATVIVPRGWRVICQQAVMVQMLERG